MPADILQYRRTRNPRPESPIVFEGSIGNGAPTTRHRHSRDVHEDEREPVGPWYVIWNDSGEVVCTIPLSILPRSLTAGEGIPKPVREFARLLSRATCRCGQCHRNGCFNRNGRVAVISSPTAARKQRVPSNRISNKFWLPSDFRSMCWTQRIREKFGITV